MHIVPTFKLQYCSVIYEEKCTSANWCIFSFFFFFCLCLPKKINKHSYQASCHFSRKIFTLIFYHLPTCHPEVRGDIFTTMLIDNFFSYLQSLPYQQVHSILVFYQHLLISFKIKTSSVWGLSFFFLITQAIIFISLTLS